MLGWVGLEEWGLHKKHRGSFLLQVSGLEVQKGPLAPFPEILPP